MPARQESAVKRWCFTINHWTVEQYGEVELLFPQHAKYLIVGKEKDEKGTLHLQGYIELNKRLRFNEVRDLFSLSNPHLERASGNPEQNKVYCSKEKDFNEWGSITRQGERSNLEQVSNSRFAARVSKELYPNSTYYKPRGEWWDGYEQDKLVVMDDFYGWIKYDELLEITDHYP